MHGFRLASMSVSFGNFSFGTKTFSRIVFAKKDITADNMPFHPLCDVTKVMS